MNAHQRRTDRRKFRRSVKQIFALVEAAQKAYPQLRQIELCAHECSQALVELIIPPRTHTTT